MYSSAHENEDTHEDPNDREYLIDLTGSDNGIFAASLRRKQTMTQAFAAVERGFPGALYFVGYSYVDPLFFVTCDDRIERLLRYKMEGNEIPYTELSEKDFFRKKYLVKVTH